MIGGETWLHSCFVLLVHEKASSLLSRRERRRKYGENSKIDESLATTEGALVTPTAAAAAVARGAT